MFTLDFKLAEPLSYEKYLIPYLKKQFNERPEIYSQDISLLESLRKDCTAVEASINSAKTCYKYYLTLETVTKVLPIDENNIRINFAWFNSFPKDKKLISSMSLKFEMACALFNAAIVYWKIAAGMSLESTESLKTACNYYMNASFIFQKILTDISGSFTVPPNCDLSSQCLSGLQKLMLGFAQQCFVQKIIREDGKDGLVSKLAAACGDYFVSAYENFNTTTLRAALGEQFMNDTEALSLYYFSIAHRRKGDEILPNRKFGEHIGRYRHAVDLMARASELGRGLGSSLLADIRISLETMRATLAGANKDNDLIYHDNVPDSKKLALLPRAEMVTPKDPFVEPIPFQAVFKNVVPLHIHQAATSFQEDKTRLVSRLRKEYDTVQSECDKLLQKLRLPATLDAEFVKGLPESLLRKSDELKHRVAPKELLTLVDQLKSLNNRSGSMLSEIFNALEKEKDEDAQKRIEYGAQWSRPPSLKVNAKLVANYEKYNKAFQDASDSDKLLLAKLDEITADITTLTSSRDELERNIPASSAHSISIVNPQAEALRKLLAELERIRRSSYDSIQKLFEFGKEEVAVLKTSQDPYEVTKETLRRVEEESSNLEKLLAEQVTLYGPIKEANAAFLATRKSTPALKFREDVIQRLEGAYHNYSTLLSNVYEGCQFYTELVDLVEKLKRQVDEYCLARAVEFQDMFRAFQSMTLAAEEQFELERKERDFVLEMERQKELEKLEKIRLERELKERKELEKLRAKEEKEREKERKIEEKERERQRKIDDKEWEREKERRERERYDQERRDRETREREARDRERERDNKDRRDKDDSSSFGSVDIFARRKSDNTATFFPPGPSAYPVPQQFQYAPPGAPSMYGAPAGMYNAPPAPSLYGGIPNYMSDPASVYMNAGSSAASFYQAPPVNTQGYGYPGPTAGASLPGSYPPQAAQAPGGNQPWAPGMPPASYIPPTSPHGHQPYQDYRPPY